MNLRKFFTLFFSTALVGLILGGITTATGQFRVSPVFGTLLGGFLSATTLMGFWAYLTLNFTMRNFISFRVWVWIQLFLIALVLYDLIYFRWLTVAGGEGSLWPFVGYALWPLAVAVVGAYFKSRLSGMRSFIPSVFYLYVFTTLEWFVALKSNEQIQMTQVGIILIACNLYILFMYTRLLTKQQPSPAR
jgi:KinB signaling pathway activation protein